jgi:hypothetical protein
MGPKIAKKSQQLYQGTLAEGEGSVRFTSLCLFRKKVNNVLNIKST